LLILLPPSETKRSGGVGISIEKAAIIWAALDPTRELVIRALEKVSKKPADAAKALKLGKKSIAEAEKNLELWTSPSMPALERYTGTLYDALDYPTLPEVAIRRAGEQLFIQSALFGLVPALEQIPDYRLSAESKLPGLSLKKLWPDAHKLVWPRLRGPILDLRSESYVALNPIPPEYESYFVEVVDSSSGRALNHFNKKAKGAFVRSALINGLDDLSSIPPAASEAGLGVQLDGNRVVLKVPSGF
jgi:cytoplasmic iron level regulating protein YaaA (DUF328/UPF0246 family)